MSKPPPPVARLLHTVLDWIPGTGVDVLRRRHRIASVVEQIVALAFRPLYGQIVVISQGEAAGLRFRVERASLAWSSGKVELPVQRALRAALRPGAVLLDIGASVGFFTILGARLVGPAGVVVAFEPQEHYLVLLRDNVGLNEFENVVVVPEAVSGSPGRRLLEGSGRPTARLVGRASGGGAGVVTVDATSVDAFLDRHPMLVPDLIKIDVEGHEPEVIDGMETTLATHRPIVLCELHGTNASVASRLCAARYALAVVEPFDRVDNAPAGAHVLATPIPNGDY
jgi:FkbM family methyltransferase